MKGIHIDPATRLVDEHYAIVNTTKHRRTRFPEQHVQVVESEQLARSGADADKNTYAARVLGPSRSSEGVRLYYLVDWLE